MALGDGAIVRSVLDAFVGFLHRFAAPTGARGSVLLMTGGLIILAFLLLALLFRSAIVGDLAPSSNGRVPSPRALMPPRAPRGPPSTPLSPGGFAAGRATGASLGAVTLDVAFESMRLHGADARILQSGETWKRVRLYRCLTCQHGAHARGCEHERGLLAGAFEAITGELAKVHETACSTQGVAFCEFEIRHAPLAEVR